MSSPHPTTGPPADYLDVEAHTHRRTALVALRGELDLVTVSKVAQVLDELGPQADGVRHVVLDLRGLTFIDVPGAARAPEAERVRARQPAQPRRRARTDLRSSGS